MSYLNMDLSDAQVGLGFDPVPAGEYLAQIVGSEVGSSKNDNMMLILTWLIIEGEHSERMVFDRVMLSGSEQSVKLGKRRLKTIAVAVGHPNPNRIDDSGELHGLPCFITISVKKGLEDYSDFNEIKNYRPLNGPNHQPAAAAPPAGGPAPPNRAQAVPRQAAAPLPARTAPPAAAKAQTPFDPPPAEADAPL